MSKILVTGADGFIGRGLCILLAQRNFAVKQLVHQKRTPVQDDNCLAMNIGPDSDWTEALADVKTVVHLAGIAHCRAGEEDYRRVNVEGTVHLARQAVLHGVQRMIFVSTIQAADPGTNPYGVSKRVAEQQLQAIAAESDMELVIIRPVLVYGAGVKGNLLSLLHWLQQGRPFPVCRPGVKRSLVSLDNLCDALCCCIESSSCNGQVFTVCDDRCLSLEELVDLMAYYLGKRIVQIPLPRMLLKAAGRCLSLIERAQGNKLEPLFTSFVVDNSEIKRQLHWQPPYSVEQGIEKMVRHVVGMKKSL
nr:NAD-dependent epimerase/dehydratase family protein [uncultured Desulfuromonas sp.]